MVQRAKKITTWSQWANKSHHGTKGKKITAWYSGPNNHSMVQWAINHSMVQCTINHSKLQCPDIPVRMYLSWILTLFHQGVVEGPGGRRRVI